MIVKLIPEGNEGKEFKLSEVIDEISKELNEKGIHVVKFKIEDDGSR